MRTRLLILIFTIAPAFAQSFEVASIHPSTLVPGQVTAGIRIDGAQVNGVLLSLRDYIRWAYDVKDYQIIAPDWLAGANFDINAKLASKATDKQIAAMIGDLLKERFQMKFHRETRELPVYALVAARNGTKLTESAKAPGADSAEDTVTVVANGNSSSSTVDGGNGESFSMGNNRLEGRKFSLDEWAEILSSFSDRPLVNLTGLKGVYDFSLKFSPDDFRVLMIRAAVAKGVPMPPEALKALDAASPDAMRAALEELGLNLETRKASLEVLVIDHLEKNPSEN